MKKPFHWFKTKIMMITIHRNKQEDIIHETSFTEPDATEATSTLQLRQKVKRDKITVLYRHLNATGDTGLADIYRFMIKK